MKKPTEHFSHLKGETEAQRSANLVRHALARNEEQLAAQKLVVASAKSDWKLLLARVKLSQLETDGKILRGEMSVDDQFDFGRALARKVTRIEWDVEALSKIKLK